MSFIPGYWSKEGALKINSWRQSLFRIFSSLSSLLLFCSWAFYWGWIPSCHWKFLTGTRAGKLWLITVLWLYESSSICLALDIVSPSGLHFIPLLALILLWLPLCDLRKVWVLWFVLGCDLKPVIPLLGTRGRCCLVPKAVRVLCLQWPVRTNLPASSPTLHSCCTALSIYSLLNWICTSKRTLNTQHLDSQVILMYFYWGFWSWNKKLNRR